MRAFLSCVVPTPQQILRLLTCYGLNDAQVMEIIEGSKSLIEFQLPINSKVQGWFLELLVPHLKSGVRSGLKYLKTSINTAYVPLSHTIPEPHARNICNTLEADLKMSVDLNFLHLKLP